MAGGNAPAADSPEHPWSLTMRNDYATALHGALLLRLGVKGARAFWERHPLARDGRDLSLAELAEHLGKERATSPVAWVMGLVGGLAPFLLERGVDYAGFVEATRRLANRGTFSAAARLPFPTTELRWLGSSRW
jgi:hypothetical protein